MELNLFGSMYSQNQRHPYQQQYSSQSHTFPNQNQKHRFKSNKQFQSNQYPHDNRNRGRGVALKHNQTRDYPGVGAQNRDFIPKPQPEQVRKIRLRTSTPQLQSRQQQLPQPLKLMEMSPNEYMDKNRNSELKTYVCLGCTNNFDCFIRNGIYVGRVPLILNCKHTICQVCIIKSFQEDNVVCPDCKNPSKIRQRDLNEKCQEIFSPNFYIFGSILWHKTHNVTNLDLKLMPVKDISENSILPSSYKEVCCFVSCRKPATLRCQECEDIYCEECCVTIHKSAKSMWSHKQVPVTDSKFSAILEKCKEHSTMDVEYFCLNCKIGACCYCLIDKHTGHEKSHLSKLDDHEMQLFAAYKEKILKNLKRLMATKKKIMNLRSFNTSSMQKQITEYFIGLFARVQFLEKNLQKSAATFQHTQGVNGKLEEIFNEVEKSIALSKDALAVTNYSSSQKVNLKKIFKTLEELQSIPCYMLEKSTGKEPLEFYVDPVLQNIEDYFKIVEPDIPEYVLVTEEQLPDDYSDPIDKETETDIESCLSRTMAESADETMSSVSGFKPIPKPIAHYPKRKSGAEAYESVEVTHIESLECFYVQSKKVQFRLLQLNREIENFAKIAPMVDHSMLTLNDTCLALYQTRKEKFWSRGRIVEIKNGENGPLYEIFFLDYGNTQTVNIANIRESPLNIMSKKAFAIQCELYNPTNVEWAKNLHIQMGKIINGKEIFMLVKSIHNGIHIVDLMVSSREHYGLTSVIDILIHSVPDCLNATSSESNGTPSLNSFQDSGEFMIFNDDYKIFGSSVVFHKNQTEDVLLAHVVDPHNIFIHIARYSDALKRLTKSMKNYFKSQPACIMPPAEGSFIIVENKDPVRGNVHRALVKKVNIVKDEVSVFCVDWGINVTVPLHKIRQLKHEFTKLETQAIVVKLVHVAPYNKMDKWSEQASQFLQSYFRRQDVLKMVVHNTDPTEVALFERNVNADICINALLVQSNLADSVGSVSKITEWLHENTLQTSPPEDDGGLVSELVNKIDNDSDSDSDNDEAKKYPKQKIDIVKFVNPDLIFIKFVHQEKTEQELHNDLQVYYFDGGKTQEEWNVDDMCVVLCGNSYARGKIIDKKGDKYTVNMYDRALDVEVDVDKIFQYDKYFNKFPNVVFKAYLADIAPAGGDKWSLASIEVLQKIFTRYSNIFATKVTGDTSKKYMPLKMWYTKVIVGGALVPSVTKYKSINDFLVKSGYAYKKTSIKAEEEVNESIQLESSVISSEATAETSRDSDVQSIADESKTSWIELVEEEEHKATKSQTDSPYRTREAEIKDWKPAFPITEETLHAWVTCVETGGIMYIRPESLQLVYKDLEKNIKEFFDDNNTQLNRKNHKWQVGQLCTIKYENYWYRGKVQEIISPSEIIVIMIDFGSDHNVTPDCLYREILYPDLPAFASQIKLDRIYAKSGKWLTSDYETFRSIVPEYAKIVIKGPLDAEIPSAEVYNDEGVSVNDLLVENCPNLTRNLQEEQIQSDDENVVIEDIVECSDDNMIIGFNMDSSKMFNGSSHTTNLSYLYEDLPEGEKTRVFVLQVLKYNKVVLRNITPTSDDYISNITKTIQPYVNLQPVLKDITIGTPCICPYSGDGLWYRAEVYNVSGLDNGTVMVYFVDYGNIESVAVEKVRKMKPEWFKFSTQSSIALLNFELKKNDDLEDVFQEVLRYFEQFKTCQVVSKNPLTVNLYDDNGELSYKTLLDSGLIVLKSD